MSVAVFLGPSLGRDEAAATLAADYLPPVAQGDVYRAALGRPRAIGIVDGGFENVPAVWHKEILWAMDRGIHVFGAASMGALRAAELAAFGMAGVGWIFEAYRDGRLEDDDEVAVIHGPAELGYRALTEAMVNVRRTVEAAERAGVVDAAAGALLTRAAKELFYKERAYPRILERAGALGLADGALGAFRAWLPGGRVDQKREDARAMLRAMGRHLAEARAPKRVGYRFEHTDMWAAAVAAAGVGPTGAEPGDR